MFKQQDKDFWESYLWTQCMKMKMLKLFFAELLRLVHLWPMHFCRVLVCVCACVRSHACVRKSRCEGGAKPHGFVRAMCVRAGVFWASHTCAIAPEIFQTFFLILLKKKIFQQKIEKKFSNLKFFEVYKHFSKYYYFF